jgi:hypothetical protein
MDVEEPDQVDDRVIMRRRHNGLAATLMKLEDAVKGASPVVSGDDAPRRAIETPIRRMRSA